MSPVQGSNEHKPRANQGPHFAIACQYGEITPAHYSFSPLLFFSLFEPRRGVAKQGSKHGSRHAGNACSTIFFCGAGNAGRDAGWPFFLGHGARVKVMTLRGECGCGTFRVEKDPTRSHTSRTGGSIMSNGTQIQAHEMARQAWEGVGRGEVAKTRAVALSEVAGRLDVEHELSATGGAGAHAVRHELRIYQLGGEPAELTPMGAFAAGTQLGADLFRGAYKARGEAARGAAMQARNTAPVPGVPAVSSPSIESTQGEDGCGVGWDPREAGIAYAAARDAGVAR